MTTSCFPLFDDPRKPSVEVIDGIPTFVSERHGVEDLAVLEPVDARCDSFAAVPLRSAWHDACGPSFEIGPFDLGPDQVVALYNSLSQHIERFPTFFRRKSGAA